MAAPQQSTITKLNANNYFSWMSDMKFLLIERNGWDIVNGVETEPVIPEKGGSLKELNDYKSRARLALATIFLNVGDDLKRIIEDCDTASDAWVKLKTHFSPDSRARQMILFTQLFENKLKVGETIDMFASRVKQISNQLVGIGKALPEDCYSLQVLRYLPVDYDPIVQSILRWPDSKFHFDAIVNELVSEEARLKLREMDRSKCPDVNFSTKFRKNTKITCFKCGMKGHVKSQCKNKIKQDKPDNKNQRQSRPKFQYNSSSNSRSPSFKRSYLTEAMVGCSYSEPPSEWIFDTAATHHMCGRKELFCEFKEVHGQELAVAIEGVKHQIEGQGTIKADFGHGILKFCNVLYCSSLRRNLISAAKIDVKDGYFEGENGKIKVYDSDGKGIFSAYLKDGIYYISPRKFFNSDNTEVSFTSSTDVNRVVDWHRRFSHINSNDISMTAKCKGVRGLPFKVDNKIQCKNCQINKFKRVSFKAQNRIRSNNPLELLHMDVWGPSQHLGKNGEKFFLSIIDDYSRKVSIYPLFNKFDVFKVFLNHIKRAERFLNLKLKAIRTDKGGEFINQKFKNYCEENGVKHEQTNPYTPEENGVAERYNQTVAGGIRTLLSDSNLGKEFWPEAALHFTYAWNRVCHSGNSKTPFELYGGKIPSVKHLKPFGSPVLLGVPKQTISKFDPRAKQGFLVGYAARTRGFRIYIPEEDRVVESVNVKFQQGTSSGAVLGIKDYKDFNNKNVNGDLIFRPSLQAKQDVLTDSENEESEVEETPEAESETEEESEFDTSELQKTTWRREARKRKDGSRVDIYYFEQGSNKRLRSLKDIEIYCNKHALLFTPDLFSFSGSNTFSGIVGEQGKEREEPVASTSQ